MIRGRILCVSGAALAARARHRALCWEHAVPGGLAGRLPKRDREQSSHSEFILPSQNFLGIRNTQGHPVGRGEGTLMRAAYES